jgi:hypothetical protein
VKNCPFTSDAGNGSSRVFKRRSAPRREGAHSKARRGGRPSRELRAKPALDCGPACGTAFAPSAARKCRHHPREHGTPVKN